MTSIAAANERIEEQRWHLLGLADLREAVAVGDWSAIRVRFGELDNQTQSWVGKRIANRDGSEAWLTPAVEADPDDHIASTLLAARFVVIGWKVRSGAMAKHVSMEQFQGFHGWLSKAEELLIAVAARNPAYALAMEWRVTCARGLELGLAEARRRYDKLAAVDPVHTAAQKQYLQQILPKWGGSWEAAEAFVLECREAAPMGSPSRALITTVYVERWLTDNILPKKQDLEMLGAAANESVFHPDHVPSVAASDLHAELALLLWLGDSAWMGGRHFMVLDQFPSLEGWDYLAKPEKTYAEARAQGLAGKAPDLAERMGLALGNGIASMRNWGRRR